MDAQELKKYLAENEIDVQSARAAFNAADWVFRAYSDSAEITGVDYDHVHCYFGQGADVFYQLISRDDIKKVSKKFYEDYLENPEGMRNKIQAQQKLALEIDRLGLEYLERAEGGIPDAEFAGYFRKINELAYEWWKCAATGEDKAEVVNWEVVPRFQKRHGISYEDAREAVSVLAHPDEMAVFNQERKNFFEICLTVNRKIHSSGNDDFAKAWEDKNVQPLVDKYIRDFFWIKTNFYEATRVDGYSLRDEVKNELKIKNEADLENELAKIEDNFSNIHASKNELKKRYALREVDLMDIEFSQKAILWFDQRKSGMMKQFYYIYSMLREITERKKIDYHTCTAYFMEELFDLLEKDVRVDPLIIAKRESGVFLAFEHGKRNIFFGDEARDLFGLASKIESASGLMGVVASRGGQEKIRGIVSIILRPDKSDFEAGRILVTSMTRIEFVPLMKKAIAIITDEGGLACHAAIVSRELGLPAIIGTKNATRILQDGDEVELDLKTGEIRAIRAAISAA
ncbi:MAG: PEP-utilizing enzyme [Parcubacteria group bacterium]